MTAERDLADPYLWLEDIDSAEVCAWVGARNAESAGVLCDDGFERDRATLLAVFDAPDRIPWIGRRGRFVYNFWRDASNPKGIWRRATLASHRSGQREWETVIDIDALARAEGKDWVWSGCTALPPDFSRGLIRLSRGGADAVVIREFDLDTKRFIADGFSLPEAKGSAAWIDRDTLLVSSALGGDEFRTTSGYSRCVRKWRRGTPFADSAIIFTGEQTDMGVWGVREHHPLRPRTVIARHPAFFRDEWFVENADGTHAHIDLPSDAQRWLLADWLIVTLRSEWTVGGRRYPAGVLLVVAFDAFMRGGREFTVLFEPSERRFLDTVATAGEAIGFKVLDNVRSYLFVARVREGRWVVEPITGFPDMAALGIGSLATDDSDAFPEAGDANGAFVVTCNNSVMPPSLSLVLPGETPQVLDREPSRFDASGLTITQHEAISIDGERIPYFQIARENLVLDGSNATLLNGYGGFEISLLPNYSASVGRLWLERGGVYVIANLRGGGEFGPAWHKAGMREGKWKAHEDFAAVAADLIARKVTRRERLACEGGSNGGLLVGNMLTRHPELFGAIACAVPLLDMRRYNKLLAGASWMAEYGDPDKSEDWVFLQKISAYQAVAPGRPYPPILLTSSARDDRVHPGHARKMAARLGELGYRTYFYEPPQGGHGGATDNAQLAYLIALRFAFLQKTIAPEMARR